MSRAGMRAAEEHGSHRRRCRSVIERCVAMYFGEVIVKNRAEFKWEVREFAFDPGTYEIGVVRGTIAVMLTRFSDVHARPNERSVRASADRAEDVWRTMKRSRIHGT